MIGRALHERPRGEDEQHDQDHHDVRIVGDAGHPAGDRLRNALEDYAVPEHGGQGEQEHHRTHIDKAALERLLEAWRA